MPQTFGTLIMRVNLKHSKKKQLYRLQTFRYWNNSNIMNPLNPFSVQVKLLRKDLMKLTKYLLKKVPIQFKLFQFKS